ncbi:MAG: hypothetical protein WDZ88_04375 [Candidatus Paceibacterota bacterium]
MEPLIWSDYEYIYTKKTADWYWAVGIVGTALVVAPLLFNNIMLALLIAIGLFSLVLFASKKPRMVEFEINEKGIRIDRTLYPYDSIESFCVSDESVVPTLYIQLHSFFMPLVSLPIELAGEEEVRERLSKHLKEKILREPLPQKILEYFGF